MICCYAMSRFRVVSCASHETPLLIIMKLVALSKWFVTHYTLQRSSESFNIGDRTTVKLSNKYSNSDHNTKKQHKHFHHTSLFYPPFFNLKNLQAPSKPLTKPMKTPLPTHLQNPRPPELPNINSVHTTSNNILRSYSVVDSTSAHQHDVSTSPLYNGWRSASCAILQHHTSATTIWFCSLETLQQTHWCDVMLSSAFANRMG